MSAEPPHETRHAMTTHSPAVIAYIETALWSSCDDEGTPLDQSYDIDDVAPETAQQAQEDLDGFYSLLSPSVRDTYALSDLARDFWLTRNGHGAGFWDGAYPEAHGHELTTWAKSYGSIDLYVGDDGKVYGQ